MSRMLSSLINASVDLADTVISQRFYLQHRINTSISMLKMKHSIIDGKQRKFPVIQNLLSVVFIGLVVVTTATTSALIISVYQLSISINTLQLVIEQNQEGWKIEILAPI